MKTLFRILSKMAIGLAIGTAVAVLGIFTYFFIANFSAETKARNFCAGIAMGSKTTVKEILSDAALKNADMKLSYKIEDSGDSLVTIVWRGALMRKCNCNISLEKGEVTGKRISHLD